MLAPIIALGAQAAALLSASPVNASPFPSRALAARQSTESQGPKFIPSPVEHSADVSLCQGYRAENVQESDTGLDATLQLIGEPCKAFGTDYQTLNLSVRYETGEN
jgi:hypothetical protein